MSKKHFIAIAKIINAQFEVSENAFARVSIESTAKELAFYFESENPRFDTARFLTACGIEE